MGQVGLQYAVVADIAALTQRICADIDAERETLLDLCARLVAARSTNPPGHTTDVAAIVAGYLQANGVEPQCIVGRPEKPNILGLVQGEAGMGPTIVFNGHMDTMEPSGESAWTVPRFELTRRDGRLYGLGIGNMKGGLAGLCLATAVLNRHRPHWGGRIAMTAVADEVMFGDDGAALILRSRPELKGDYLICGEGPGFMACAAAEKGLLWVDLETRGDVGHSSAAQPGRTAIAKLATVLAELDRGCDLASAMPSELSAIDGGPEQVGRRVTVNIGTLGSAGTVRSQIAATAQASLDIRLPPGVSAAMMLAYINEVGGAALSRTTTVKITESSWTALDNPLIRTIGAAAESVRGKPTQYVVRLPGSDARRWREMGVPAVCYGPQSELSAGVDEYVYEQDVLDCAKIYATTAIQLMARGRRD